MPTKIIKESVRQKAVEELTAHHNGADALATAADEQGLILELLKEIDDLKKNRKCDRCSLKHKQNQEAKDEHMLNITCRKGKHEPIRTFTDTTQKFHQCQRCGVSWLDQH